MPANPSFVLFIPRRGDQTNEKADEKDPHNQIPEFFTSHLGHLLQRLLLLLYNIHGAYSKKRRNSDRPAITQLSPGKSSSCFWGEDHPHRIWPHHMG